ncbi:cupin domain-containing protein [Arcicella sp. LKC2W]|uniref:cupin domain-containing protein n=1 Tax=Arcicella sp. LKC2W TaxID=2984198 RepID=UPI002B1F3744|nr:cupin domain-containing protein [Arcicella sp. LKC2W]MEA5461668.1 cupin domain-containing protein [Arcicella sp. LKC2W]
MKTFNDKGIKIEMVQSQIETNGLLTLLKVSVQPNFENKKHIHSNLTETFKVTDGTIKLRVGEGVICLEQGEAFSVNAGIPHHFINDTDKNVSFLVCVMPGSSEYEDLILNGGDI